MPLSSSDEEGPVATKLPTTWQRSAHALYSVYLSHFVGSGFCFSIADSSLSLLCVVLLFVGAQFSWVSNSFWQSAMFANKYTTTMFESLNRCQMADQLCHILRICHGLKDHIFLSCGTLTVHMQL